MALPAPGLVILGLLGCVKGDVCAFVSKVICCSRLQKVIRYVPEVEGDVDPFSADAESEKNVIPVIGA